MKSLFIHPVTGWRNGWRALAYFVLAIGLVAGMIFLRRMLPADLRPYVPELGLASLGFVLVAWFFLHREGAPLRSLGLTPDLRTLRLFLLGLAGGMGLLGATAAVVWLAGGYHLEVSPQAGWDVVLKSLRLMFLVALSEELFFHGYAFQRALRGLGRRWAQIVFALLFCAAHGMAPNMSGSAIVFAMANIGLAGALLGLCYLRTGSLALPVGVHMGWNWLMATLGFNVSGNAESGLLRAVYHDRPDWLTGGSFGLEASAVSVLVLILAIWLLARWQGSNASAL